MIPVSKGELPGRSYLNCAVRPVRSQPDREMRRALLNADKLEVIEEELVAAARFRVIDLLECGDRCVAVSLQPNSQAERLRPFEPSHASEAHLRIAIKA